MSAAAVAAPPVPAGPCVGQQLLLIRWGGIGDTLWITPALRMFREQGYAITVHTNAHGAIALENCPHVEGVTVRVERPTFGAQFNEWVKYFHRVVNLQESIEGRLCFHQHHADRYYANHWMRQTVTDYQDETLAACGFPHARGLLPDIWLSDVEAEVCERFAESHAAAGTLPVLWNPLGSSINKHHLRAGEWIAEALRRFDPVVVYVVGDERSARLPGLPASERCKVAAGQWSLRKQLIFAATCTGAVVGPESGLIVAAATGAAPKVVIFSASAPANVSRYWLNTYNVEDVTPSSRCHPCYRIPREPENSPECSVWGEEITTSDGKGHVRPFLGTRCVVELDPELIYAALADIVAGRPRQTCPICAAKVCRELRRGWRACANCASVWRETAPAEAEAGALEALMATPQYRVRERHLAATYLPKIEHNVCQPGTLLDVGFGVDETMAVAAARGWQAEGADLVARPTRYQAFTGDAFNGAVPDRTWDLVWAYHVAHEQADPLGALRRLASMVRPGGALFFSTPNPESGSGALGEYLGGRTRVLPSCARVEAALTACGMVMLHRIEVTAMEMGLPYWGDVSYVWRRDGGAATAAGVSIGEKPEDAVLHLPAPELRA